MPLNQINSQMTFEDQFIFDTFFPLLDKYPGSRQIASSLVEIGNCIVPGESCIWVGGIGNFIKIKSEKDFYGCVRYVFDKENFMKSEWYKENLIHHIKELSNELNAVNERKSDLEAQIKYFRQYDDK